MDRLLAPTVLGPLVAAAILLALGLTGAIGAGWGYALFLASVLLLAGAAASLSLLALTRRFDTGSLRTGAATLGLLGAWCYLLAVTALAGHFVHETLAGRMETRWILFGPSVLVALVILDVGLYRALVRNNLPTWRRYRAVVDRSLAEPAAMRRTLLDDVIVHRALLGVSALRWLRHTLIFWGFTLMFAAELVAVMVREGFPAFGFTDIWEVPGHPVRLAFDFVYDLSGLMMLVGCVLAIVWRIRVNATEERRFADTPTTVFLLAVVASGFALEALRIAAEPGGMNGASFVGLALSAVVPSGAGHGTPGFEALWLTHVLGSCAFIAYVPARRLVHSCATPMGRLMGSQKALLAAKKRAVLGGLMAHRG